MEIEHQSESKRFSVEVEGCTAYVEYELKDGGLIIRRTIVPEQVSGRGIAAALVRSAYDYARTQLLKPMATCSYAVAWLEKHPEYLD